MRSPADAASVRRLSAATAGRAAAQAATKAVVMSAARSDISVAPVCGRPGPLPDEARYRGRLRGAQADIARPAFEPGFALDSARSRGRRVRAVPERVVQRDEAIADRKSVV